MPAGADAVVIQEDTERAGDAITVREAAKPGANIRVAGGDFRAGDVLLRVGRLLDASAITLAAAAGHATLKVRRRRRASPSWRRAMSWSSRASKPGPGQIVSSNPYGLAALVKRFGADAKLLGIAGDTLEDLAAKLATAADADVLVTIGGASVGDRDLVKPALEARGLKLDFWKVAVRPGKPMLFGRLDAHARAGVAGQPALLPHRGAHLPRAADFPPTRDAAILPWARAPPSWRTISRPTARASTTCAARWRGGKKACRTSRRSPRKTVPTCRHWRRPTCLLCARQMHQWRTPARWCASSPSTFDA